jgi:hypothetical protein
MWRLPKGTRNKTATDGVISAGLCWTIVEQQGYRYYLVQLQYKAFGRIRAVDHLHSLGANLGKCELALRRVDSLIQMQQMPVQDQKPTEKSDLKLVLK